MHFVYILYSQSLNKYYTEETSILDTRLNHHITVVSIRMLLHPLLMIGCYSIVYTVKIFLRLGK